MNIKNTLLLCTIATGMASNIDAKPPKKRKPPEFQAIVLPPRFSQEEEMRRQFVRVDSSSSESSTPKTPSSPQDRTPSPLMMAVRNLDPKEVNRLMKTSAEAKPHSQEELILYFGTYIISPHDIAEKMRDEAAQKLKEAGLSSTQKKELKRAETNLKEILLFFPKPSQPAPYQWSAPNLYSWDK